MIALDTNVLVRALAGDDPLHSPIARDVLSALSEEARGFVSLTVMAELYWVLTRSLRISDDRALLLLDGLLRTVELEIEDGESVSEAIESARRGADFADALIHATSRLYGIAETVTFDQAAARRLGWRLLA